MQENISSKNDSLVLEDQDDNSHQQRLEQFAQKASMIFDQADQKIQNLIEDIDHIMASEENITIIEKSVDQDRSNDSFWYERPAKVEARQNTPETGAVKTAKKLTLSSLNKKKQHLLHQLRGVDKELLEEKFQPSQSIKQLKQIRSSKSRKQNLDSGQQKQKLPKINSNKSMAHNQGAHRTLELMQQLNREKIKRHEDMIQRMQFRQQEQLKKIRQLEERRIKIELKKNSSNPPLSEPKNTLNMNQKRTLPSLPKKVF